MSTESPRLELRRLTPDDFEAVVALQLLCFPNMEPWSRAHFDSQLRHFPEGQVGIELDGELIATAAALIVDDAEYEDWHDWRDIADSGYIRNHDPEGDTLYGIEMQVHPDHRGMKLSRRLYDARKELCRRKNLVRMRIGGRIPGYAEVKDEMSAADYVRAVIEKRRYDPVLTSQLSNGFHLVQVVPAYLTEDEDSAGYATMLQWVNLDYQRPQAGRHRRAYYPVRVGLVQYPMRRVSSFEDFAERIEYFVDTASDYRADFLLFPELISVQLLSLVEATRPADQARELAGFAARYIELFRSLAMRYNINLVGASTFVLRDEHLYNVAFLFRRDGTVEEQPKLHITPAEARWWGVRGGDELRTFETDRGRIGLLICYDVEFPELCRKIADDGAKLLFVPFNTNDRQGYLRVRTCAHARCIENHQYVVIAGCVGHLPRVENADLHYARSAVLTPCDIAFPANGVAAETAPAIEELIIQDVDLEQLRRHRAQGTVRNWDDRRTDLYGVRWHPADSDI